MGWHARWEFKSGHTEPGGGTAGWLSSLGSSGRQVGRQQMKKCARQLRNHPAKPTAIALFLKSQPVCSAIWVG